MTKYVGKHRVPTTRKYELTQKRIVASGAALAGILAVPLTPHRLAHDEPSLLSSSTRVSTDESTRFWEAPDGWTVPEPPAEGNGLHEYISWVDSGKPGYIAEAGISKGVGEPVELPIEEVVQPVSECWFGPGSNLGLTQNANDLYQAVCAAFPAVTSYGGYRAGDPQDHGTGSAVDIMVYQNTPLGEAVTQFILENHETLHVKYLIWQQRIWQPDYGWSWMEDRGSVTENHGDHVHCSVY